MITKEQRIAMLKNKDIEMECLPPYSGFDLEEQRKEFINMIKYEENLYGAENVKITSYIHENGNFVVNFSFEENDGNKDYTKLVEAHSVWFDSVK